MDAAEGDSDVKLYKASTELLLELQAKVPRLVTVPAGTTFRKWVLVSKCVEVTRLLDTFQDWPQLLDSHLASLVQVLVDAYLSYCASSSQEYLREHDLQDSVWPLPRAIARVLYALCKVRGQKIIVRLLNNEPKYIEPMISCFRLWTRDAALSTSKPAAAITWEERYIHLLWLSHLMLAPFELSTISGLSISAEDSSVRTDLRADLPAVAVNLLSIALDHLHMSSKAREAAGILLVRLSLRSDMQKIGLANRLVKWTISELRSDQIQTQTTGYRQIGLLALLFSITNSATTSESHTFLGRVFSLAHQIATSPLHHFQAIRDAAPARKLLIKIIRSAMVNSILAVDTSQSKTMNFDIDTMLDDSIQTLLDALADKDTPIRQAASKALSQICMKLQEDMSSEVVEAVIESLNENLLLEDLESGKLFPITDVPKSTSHNFKKNVNAVDPLKWHGCMLTLGHLLFRRSLPLSQLAAVIQVLLMGLEFEQRSNVGTTVGASVRDAACFGLWSLARKYSTTELNNISVYATSTSSITDVSTLQLIATHLATSACLDPSGNLRRGSSAALQELIGRHPDAVAEGIPVVQVIDYTAVARRSRAVTEIAIAASKLHSHYHIAVLYAMLGWRGAKATDADSRRQAAQAVALLLATTTEQGILEFLAEIVTQLKRLRPMNTGSNAASRHGLLHSLAAVLDTLNRPEHDQRRANLFTDVIPTIQDITSFVGVIDGRVTADLESVCEGVSKVIRASASFLASTERQTKDQMPSGMLASWIASVRPILERCTVSSDQDFVTSSTALANIALWTLSKGESQQALSKKWLDPDQQSKADFISKGRIITLGRLFIEISSKHNIEGWEYLQQSIARYLTTISQLPYRIETRVHAMQSIKVIFEHELDISSTCFKLFINIVNKGLVDYTIDRRGDIGSLLRLESIDAVRNLNIGALDDTEKQRFRGLLVRLASEKLVKVRFQAWNCLQLFLEPGNSAMKSFQHQADVSSFEYFRNLFELIKDQCCREQLLLGLVTSMMGGTEKVTRACGQALVACIRDQDADVQQKLVHDMIESASKCASSAAGDDDREVLPMIDFLAFLVEYFLASQQTCESETKYDQIWHTCQKLHVASSSILRIEAMIRLYSALTLIESCRRTALDKLTRLLLHRWPKVRGAAADSIYIRAVPQSISICDWNLSAAENKSVVLALRKKLNVAGLATAG